MPIIQEKLKDKNWTQQLTQLPFMVACLKEHKKYYGSIRVTCFRLKKKLGVSFTIHKEGDFIKVWKKPVA